MKSLIPVVVIAGLVFYSSAHAYKVGEKMPIAAAEKRWGSQPFLAERFRTAGPGERARMVVDLVRKRSFVGKSPSEVFESLGRPDGHFFSDLVPAYLLNEGWKTTEDTWQLVFLLGAKGETVSEAIIHKNCCP